MYLSLCQLTALSMGTIWTWNCWTQTLAIRLCLPYLWQPFLWAFTLPTRFSLKWALVSLSPPLSACTMSLYFSWVTCPAPTSGTLSFSGWVWSEATFSFSDFLDTFVLQPWGVHSPDSQGALPASQWGEQLGGTRAASAPCTRHLPGEKDRVKLRWNMNIWVGSGSCPLQETRARQCFRSKKSSF